MRLYISGRMSAWHGAGCGGGRDGEGEQEQGIRKGDRLHVRRASRSKGPSRRDDYTVGRYSVPAVLIYPRNRRGNDVGVVDWLNSAAYHFFPDTEERYVRIHVARDRNYLFEEGYTYLTIQWDKAVTERFGPTSVHKERPQPPGLRLHRAQRRRVGDPAGRRTAAEESEQISREESARASASTPC